MINKHEKINDIISYLDEVVPNAKCELNYNTDYELVISVMLSAQTTDKSVNRVTSTLFEHYPTLISLKNASEEDITKDIKSLGLVKNKAKNVKGIATMLVDEFDSIVPREREELTKLPGVGRKTANVVRCELFHEAELPVDTHVERIAKRLKLAKSDDSVLEVEKKLRKAFEPSRYIKTHHQFIHFGRYYCKSQNPKCENCKLKKYCSYIVKEK